MPNSHVGYASLLFQEPSHEGLSEEEFSFFCDYQDRCEAGDVEEPCDFKFITSNNPDRKNVLFFSHGESGDVDAVIMLVTAFIEKFPLRKNLIFTFQWAEWFDSPVVGGFYGGAAIVCSTGSYWFSNDSTVKNKVSEIRDLQVANLLEEEAKVPPLSESKEAHCVWRDKEGNWKSKQLLNREGGETTVAAIGSAIVFGGSSDSFIKGN